MVYVHSGKKKKNACLSFPSAAFVDAHLESLTHTVSQQSVSGSMMERKQEPFILKNDHSPFIALNAAFVTRRRSPF